MRDNIPRNGRKGRSETARTRGRVRWGTEKGDMAGVARLANMNLTARRKGEARPRAVSLENEKKEDAHGMRSVHERQEDSNSNPRQMTARRAR